MHKENQHPIVNALKDSINKGAHRIRNLTDRFNRAFNRLSVKTQKIIVMLFGLTIASISMLLIMDAIRDSDPFSIDKIKLPMEIKRSEQDRQELMPLGKMKGEFNGEFEAFYLAVDAEGRLFINRELEYSENAYDKSNGWQPISNEQLEMYRKQLHFIPDRKNGLKR